MKRHSEYKKLYHASPNFSLNNIKHAHQDLWKLPPYLISHFGGQLTKVMQAAAEEYLYYACLDAAKKNFHETAFPPNHPH